MHRPLIALAVIALASGESDDKAPGGRTGGDALQTVGRFTAAPVCE